MSQTKRGSRIRVSLEILDEDGEVVEFSDPEDPVELEIGDGTLPPTVEEALEGRRVGETIEITCPEGEAFGDPSPEAVAEVAREDLPPELELVEGEYVELDMEESDEDGDSTLVALVVEVTEDTVRLDLNHPLAGKPATFRVTIESLV